MDIMIPLQVCSCSRVVPRTLNSDSIGLPRIEQTKATCSARDIDRPGDIDRAALRGAGGFNRGRPHDVDDRNG